MANLLNISGVFQNGPMTSGDNSDKFPNYFLSEKEKLEDDKIALKRIFNYHQSLALAQIGLKRRKFDKNYKMAAGVIDPQDYGLGEEEGVYDKEFDILTPGEKLSDSIKLEFFAITPNIINSLQQEQKRKYNNYYPRAIDSDSINEILQTKNEEIVNLLVEDYKQRYVAKLSPEVQGDEASMKEAMDHFQKLPLVEQFYRSEYKPEIVQWAEHQMKRDELVHDLDTLGSDVFEDQLIQGERYLHVADTGNDYVPEYLKPDLVATIQSPLTKCSSMATMVHWFEHMTLQGAISKYDHHY